MVLHGAMGDYQPLGDLLVRQPGADHPQDLRLTLGELRGAWSWIGGQLAELAENQPSQARREDRVAARRPPYRVKQLRPTGRFDDVPGGAGLHGVEHVTLL